MNAPTTDLSQLRINRDTRPRRRWLPWAVLLGVAIVAAAVYPSARKTQIIAGSASTSGCLSESIGFCRFCLTPKFGICEFLNGPSERD